MKNVQIAIIGAGNIGRILVKRWLIGPADPEQITICDADPARAQQERIDRLKMSD